ncbi:MAG: adenylyltransferase/cytidyltransferase family protein [Candidatus Uhrbacteria bacterium]|nr:adenylyltransferase/cytidyltransferase family protein [Candidatus Uhrbacteria bacterium]
MTRVLVFGTFDHLHPGHEHFLKAAQALGDELIACLSPDKIVLKLKDREVMNSYSKRKKALESAGFCDKAVQGDSSLGGYQIIKKIKPDIIALGYDQKALKADLKRWMAENEQSIVLKTISAYKPKIYKSSLLK